MDRVDEPDRSCNPSNRTRIHSCDEFIPSAGIPDPSVRPTNPPSMNTLQHIQPPYVRVIVCTMIRQKFTPRLFHRGKLGPVPFPSMSTSQREKAREGEEKRERERERDTRRSGTHAFPTFLPYASKKMYTYFVSRLYVPRVFPRRQIFIVK